MRIIKDDRVDGFLNKLSTSDSIKIAKTIRLFLDYDFSLPEKYLKKLNKTIWELRADRFRLLFGFEKDVMVIVSIFFKKTQKTPLKEIKLAIKRFKQYL